MKTLSIIYFVTTMGLIAACERGDIYETTEIDEEITALRADMDACTLVVRPSEDGTTSVEVDVSYWFEEPGITVETDGDKLIVDLECYGPCDCDGTITATVPAAVAIDADNGSGNIGIADMDGIVKASSGSGNVTVKDAAGALELESGSGNVSASRISSDIIDAHAGSGNVSISCTDKPEEVKADSGSGNVKVIVPKGDYDVDASSGSGSTRILGLVDSRDATSTIRAEAGSGNVTVKGEVR
jgi:hypothetical protein